LDANCGRLRATKCDKRQPPPQACLNNTCAPADAREPSSEHDLPRPGLEGDNGAAGLEERVLRPHPPPPRRERRGRSPRLLEAQEAHHATPRRLEPDRGGEGDREAMTCRGSSQQGLKLNGRSAQQGIMLPSEPATDYALDYTNRRCNVEVAPSSQKSPPTRFNDYCGNARTPIPVTSHPRPQGRLQAQDGQPEAQEAATLEVPAVCSLKK